MSTSQRSRDEGSRAADLPLDITDVMAGAEPPVATPRRLGSTIGQYELIRALGSGGMGEVHLARDLRLGRLVAVKLLAAHRPGLTARFLSEARTTARCNHENIVVIHEVGEHEGHPYMVLEFLQGQTLREWLHEQSTPEQRALTSSFACTPVPPGRAVEIMLPVVRALAYAHERGIVHRDLKPENIMLTRTGTVKVLDFGIAKLLAAPEPSTDGATPLFVPLAAASSAMLGTLPYMSPEQMNEDDIDHRSDLWAVGIMLFEMVTGRHPLPLRTSALLGIADELIPMPSVFERMPGLGALGAIIDRCLIKKPAHRTASARELLGELEALAPGRRVARSREGVSPFAGLAAFQEADADRFFGRARDIDHTVTQLRSRPLVAILGPSGVGKSSLIRAGVIPALKRSGEGWDACVVRPGRQPLAALASVLAQLYEEHDTDRPKPDGQALAGDSTGAVALAPLIERLRREPGYLGVRLRARATSKLRRVLVFVDQFEELYTLGASADERAAFLACLTGVADDATSPLRVILSMRSDFLDRLTEDRHVSAEVTRGLVLLPPMGRDGLREALICPVEGTSFRFASTALVDRMVDALDGIQGALPLLQFTAARLWELRDTGRRLLTEASYERIGGVAGALASHADAVLAGMASARQALARAVLERLVTPERTRALVSTSELRALHREPDAVDDVIQHLAAMRLVVIERGAEGAEHTVELVHESLIDRWPTLARWLDENQEDAAFLARLRGAAQEWEKHDRDQGLLWHGAPAREAQLWHARYRGVLPGREQAYLAAVLAMANQAARRRRWLIAGSMATMAWLLVLALIAMIQIRQAQRAADRQAEIAREQAAQAEHARREAESAREEADRQAEIAREQAEEAEQVRRLAESALSLAELERARTEQETVKTRGALRQAQQAEVRARTSATEAQGALERAETAAEAERRARRELEGLIERSLGHVSKSLPALE